MKLSTILAPTDFSPRSAAAARHAGLLANKFDARVLLAHVIEPEPTHYATMGLPAFAPETEAHRVERLREKLIELGRETIGAERFEPVLLTGDPAKRIEKLAEERHVDFVVVSTHGYGPVRRLLLGSLTSKLLHDLDCPILTGAHLEEAPFHDRGYQRIGCALGLKDWEHSEDVLRWAVEFGSAWEAELHVIHTPPAIDWAGGEWFPPDTRSLLERAAHENLDELLAKVGCPASRHVGGDDAAEYVAEIVGKQNLDLVVVGRSVDHGLFGGRDSNAYAIVRSAPCPVVSV